MDDPCVLLIDSDAGHRRGLEEALAPGGHAVESISHDSAVAHLSREDMSRYAAVVVVVKDEPSTLSSTYRLGEYVLHYMEQLCPEVLGRTIVVTPLERLADDIPSACRVLLEPVSGDVLLAAVSGAR